MIKFGKLNVPFVVWHKPLGGSGTYITLVFILPFMERQSLSPERTSPDSLKDQGTAYNNTDNASNDNGMAAMVAHPNPANMPGGATLGGVNKRYRPAPAKTFQCKGFGDCRMVFSRSEHLARHIRKHTGERPFTCHCSKQFSRLDNLRQHAQTVHADKQDQNERMMRELTSLHASMAAANKAGSGRGGRRASGSVPAIPQQSPQPPAGSSPISNGAHSSSPNHSPVSVENSLSLIKEEDLSLPLHHRQDSQQYDANGLIYHNQSPSSWGVPGADALHHQRPSSRNGFRHDAADAFHHSQSYLSYSPPLGFGFQAGDAPRSRPGTASGKGTHSLPPLSAIIPDQQEQASLQEIQQQQLAHHQQQQQGYVPSAIRPRPGTSSGRPGSSSASLFPTGNLTGPSKQPGSYYGAPGMEYNQRSSYPTLGGYDTDSATSSNQDPSPFYFHPDDSSSTSGHSPSASSARSQSAALTPPANHQVPAGVSRKRAFDAPDGPYDLSYSAQQNASHPGGPTFAYEYGSESRPQSRRLSVLELCNDGDATSGAGNMLDPNAMFGMNMNGLGGMGMNGVNGLGGMNGFLGGPEGRPTTAQIVSSASALAIFDNRDHSRSPSGSSVASINVHNGIGPDRQRASPAASVRSRGSGGRQSVRPDRPGRHTPPSRKVTPTMAAAGGSYPHASPAQGYHQPQHISQQFSQQQFNHGSQPPYSPYQTHPSLNMNIPLGVYPSQSSPTFSTQSAASTPATTYPSLQQQYLTGHHPHPQVQHLQQQHGRVGSPLSTSTQGTSSPGPRSPGVPVSPFVGQGGFAMHQQQYLQQQQGQYGQGF